MDMEIKNPRVTQYQFNVPVGVGNDYIIFIVEVVSDYCKLYVKDDYVSEVPALAYYKALEFVFKGSDPIPGYSMVVVVLPDERNETFTRDAKNNLDKLLRLITVHVGAKK